MECTCFTGHCAASDAADKAELESLEWEASGMADREAYGVTLISEDDVIGGYPDDELWNPAIWYPGMGYRTLY